MMLVIILSNYHLYYIFQIFFFLFHGAVGSMKTRTHFVNLSMLVPSMLLSTQQAFNLVN